jgi:sigma-B regulation protein RsbU (phosphoserine phosphatase)
MHFYRQIIRRVHAKPANMPNSHYQSWVLANYACIMGGIIHLVFIFVFALVGVPILSLFNILSTLIWSLAVYFNLNGSMTKSISLANLEVVVHAFLCTIIIGWSTGFHYHILVMPSIFFLTPFRLPVKIISSLANIVLYGLLNYFFQAFSPLIGLDPVLVRVFNYTNIFFFGFILAYFAYHYQAIVRHTERQLELQHRKTNEALVERNKTLVHLNAELAEAADYVKSMLPNPITDGKVKTAWRFIPSESLGGDAFGYHWIDDDHFAIYLLDVSGHGVGAALLSVSVMNALRSHSLPRTDFRDCGQVLEALNVRFPSDRNNDMFFTIWYGVYDISSRELDYASGGHPPALLLNGYRKNAREAVLLRTPNNVIGGLRGASYTKKRCRIEEDAKLYVFSDGVYEIRKSDGRMWRLNEFADYLANAGQKEIPVLDLLQQHAARLTPTSRFDDDFTIVEVVF